MFAQASQCHVLDHDGLTVAQRNHHVAAHLGSVELRGIFQACKPNKNDLLAALLGVEVRDGVYAVGLCTDNEVIAPRTACQLVIASTTVEDVQLSTTIQCVVTSCADENIGVRIACDAIVAVTTNGALNARACRDDQAAACDGAGRSRIEVNDAARADGGGVDGVAFTTIGISQGGTRPSAQGTELVGVVVRTVDVCGLPIEVEPPVFHGTNGTGGCVHHDQLPGAGALLAAHMRRVEAEVHQTRLRVTQVTDSAARSLAGPVEQDTLLAGG